MDGTMSVLLRSLLIGVLSGNRSFTPVAALALRADQTTGTAPWRDWTVFRSGRGRTSLLLAALGELAGDKLPTTPSRIGAGPLGGRAGTGALAGSALGSGDDRRSVRLAAAGLGAAGGVLGSYVGWSVRFAIGRVTGLPDPLLALVEDAITVVGSAALVRDA